MEILNSFFSELSGWDGEDEVVSLRHMCIFFISKNFFFLSLCVHFSFTVFWSNLILFSHHPKKTWISHFSIIKKNRAAEKKPRDKRCERRNVHCVYFTKKKFIYGRNDWKVHTTIIKHFFFDDFHLFAIFFLCIAGKILYTARSLDTWALCMNKKKSSSRRFEVTKKRQQNVNKLMYIASTIEICDFILIPQHFFYFDVTIAARR